MDLNFKAVIAAALAAPLVIMASTASAQQMMTEQEKLSDLDQMLTIIQNGYGPLQFKEKQFGLTLAKVKEKYVPLVKGTKSTGEFYYLMQKLITEFRDGHFSAMIPSDAGAEIPVVTDLVGDEVLIDTIDRSKLPEAQFPFSKGDKILSLNGVKVKDVLDELQQYLSSGNPKSSRRRAAMALFVRKAMVLPVPTGKLRIEIQKYGTNQITTVEMGWTESGTVGDERTETRFSATRLPRFDDLSLKQSEEMIYGKERLERSFRCSGSTRIVPPAGATILMAQPFVAYYHPTAKGNVGYLRIPDYMPMKDDGKTPDFELRYQQYEWAVRKLEENTVGLIIDQDHNCGGSVSYAEKLIGLFMNKPYKPLQFQLLANREEYLSMKSDIQLETAPFTADREFADGLVALVNKHRLAGDRMTPMTSLTSTGLLHPSPYAYTKPIVMLVDEMSGSGGDAVPALLQGYGRVTLFGSTTMGLGGHVVEQPKLTYSRLATRMTKSLFFRPDGVPVENNGAVPDIPYTITRDDFVNGYRNYQEAYLKVLLEKVP